MSQVGDVVFARMCCSITAPHVTACEHLTCTPTTEVSRSRRVNPVLYFSFLPLEKYDAMIAEPANTDSLPACLFLQLDSR